MYKNQLILISIFVFFLGFIPLISFARTPNDPYKDQWAYTDVKAYGGWDYSIGSRNVIVAVIDNGFDTFHPDLRGNVWKNEAELPYNGIDDDNNGYVDDVWGWNFADNNNNPRPIVSSLSKEEKEEGTFHHGTIVAGIIGAVGNNRKDGVGINWQVKLMNLKVLGNSGTGDLLSLPDAIYYAVDNGADVINISLVGSEDAKTKEALKYAYNKGVPVIAAAGNDMIYFKYVSRYPVCADAGEKENWLLGVSAIGEDHRIAQFSNVGSDCIDITAPGVSISSTLRYSPTSGLTEKYSGGWDGTSFAAPFVSGAAALIKSIHPEWGPSQIYEALLSTVHHTAGQDEVVYAHLFGAGLVQINKAVEYALKYVASTHSLAFVSVFQLTDGKVAEKVVGGEKIEDRSLSVIAKVDDIAGYKEAGKNAFVTVKKINSLYSLVSFYNEAWEKEKSWRVRSTSRLNIVVGNVDNDEGLEIVLAPQQSDSQIFWVFDFSGNKLAQYSLSNAHTGVSLGLVDYNGSQQILALYKDNDVITLHRFNQNYKIEKEIKLPFLHNIGVVSAGDIDGDGSQEYIVGAGKGDVSFVAYYEMDGEEKRKFFAYGFDYTSGLDIGVGDYNKDGKDDVIVSSLDGSQPVKVWNYQARKIGQWSVFDQQITDSLKILPIYK